MVKQKSKKRRLENKPKVKEVLKNHVVASVPVIDLTADADVDDEDDGGDDDDDNDEEDSRISDINSDGNEELEILYSVNPGGNVYILLHSLEPHETYKTNRSIVFGTQDTEILGVFSCLKAANNEACKYLKEMFNVDKDDIAIVDSCVQGWALKDDECDPKKLNDHVYVIVQKLR
eukprot:CAMPEP_0119040284 /NCGR_PEP_ID=MMETSP1177-20130426/10165_1 /TAXON_ID=2985 /ORGANISM="Ochromonas sp, Strain CCMP1899" /LENGTH=174 /DNA_ID=CAMNT_0007005193 /DNA_START=169 /DNA_END=693 /DNA_ORIENTATION=-